MSARSFTHRRFGRALTLVLLFVSGLSLVGRAQPPEAFKKPAESKGSLGGLPVIKLPDGTFLWTGTSGEPGGERVTLTLAETQKIQDQIDQLKKQLAAQKPGAPSGCAIRGRIEKQGEQLVAALKIRYSFRTMLPQTAINLGGRKCFIVSAASDGKSLPILETAEDGFAALIESPGDHTFALEMLAPISARGPKGELGFEIGLPRAPITTFALEPPRSDVKLVNLAMRTADPALPLRPAEVRRVALDIKQLAREPNREAGYALGPVESLEATWDAPAAATQPLDQFQSAEIDVSVLFTEAAVETTARFKLRGPAREWRLIAPQDAEFTVERANPTSEIGSARNPVPIKPNDPNKPVWKFDLPSGSSASDWSIAAIVRQLRAGANDPKHRGPFPIGPFSVLDVLRQTGTIRTTAGPHTHFAFRHGLDLHQVPVPGPIDDDVSLALFRLTTGPTGTTPPNTASPLLSVEAIPQMGSIIVKPTYKLTLEKIPLSEDVWHVRAEIRVVPNHTTLESLAIEIPAEWQGADASLPSESVPGVALGTKPEGFWPMLAAKMTKGWRVPTILRLPTGQKQAFDLNLDAFIRVPAGASEIAIPLLRFPGAFERDVAIAATVPEGQEVRGEARGWDGDSAASWGIPLNPVQTTSTKPNKSIGSIAGKSPLGLSRALLAWNPAIPDLTAEIRAECTVSDRQMDIAERIKIRSVEGLPSIVRFHTVNPTSSIAGMKPRSNPAFVGQFQQGHQSGEWIWSLPADAKEATLDVSYAVPFDRRQVERTSTIPVGLLWPVGATRTESAVRIWSNASSARALSTQSSGWRELPPEPAADRDALPALTLLGSSGELPLALEMGEIGDGSATTDVWVDRVLIQALVADDEATRYRALFLLQRWVGTSVELRLPGPFTGASPEFRWEKNKVDAVPLADSTGSIRAYRIPVPEHRPGKTLAVDVRYRLPASRSDIGEAAYPAPTIANAAFAGPTRWQLIFPQGTLPILASGAIPEFHWRWRLGGYSPTAARSDKELEKWFGAGEDISSGDDAGSSLGESITARQASPEAISIYRLPRTACTIASSFVAFFAILGFMRLPAAALGPVLVALGCTIGIAAILLPHGSAQLAGSCQPGLAAALALIFALSAGRAYSRHLRSNRLPSFARTFLEPSGSAAPLPNSSRNRPSSLGPANPLPAAQAGG